MSTKQITTDSETNVWVLVATKSENVELQCLTNDVWLKLSDDLPTNEEDVIILNQELFKNFTPDNINNLYAFIHKNTVLIRRSTDAENQSANIDFSGKQSMNTVTGEKVVGERTDGVNVMFQYNVSNYDTISVLTGTALLSHETSKAIVGTGTGVGRSSLSSKDSIRYLPGHEVNVELTVDFGTPEINVNQKAGIGNETDGFAGFGYKGVDFGIWLRTVTDGVFHIPQTEWNYDKLDGTGISNEILNQQNLNIYKITYGWYGVLPVHFFVHTKTVGWVLCHVFTEENETQEPHVGNPTLPVRCCVERTAGTGSNVTLKTSSWRGGIVGKIGNGVLINRNFLIKTSKTIVGNNIPVYSLRSLANFKGKVNQVRCKIGTVTISTDGTKAVQFDIYKSGTLTGGTWNAIDLDNSVIEYNNTATSFIPSGALYGGTVVGKVDKERINLIGDDVVIPIYPGETLHFVATTANSSEIILYFRHVEEF